MTRMRLPGSPRRLPRTWDGVPERPPNITNVQAGVSAGCTSPMRIQFQPMDHSLLAASRTTHVKIVVVALLGAILVVSVGIAAHVSGTPSAAVLKAGQSVTYTGHNGTLAR